MIYCDNCVTLLYIFGLIRSVNVIFLVIVKFVQWRPSYLLEFAHANVIHQIFSVPTFNPLLYLVSLRVMKF